MSTSVSDAPAPAPSRRQRITAALRRTPLLRNACLALLALVVVFLVLESVPPFRQGQLAVMAYLALAAGGLTVLTGLNGQLSLGHGAFMAVGAYTTALLLRDNENPPPLVVIMLIAMLVTLVIGAVVGLAAARLHGPYIAGATLALAVAVPGVAIHFYDQLGGEPGITVSLPDVPVWLGDAWFFLTGSDTTTRELIAYLGWFTVIVCYFLLANLSASGVGRRWRAVRDDETSASLSGINLGANRVLAFVVSTACAGLAGSLLAMVTRIAAPGAFPLALSLSLLAAVVLGGLGSLLGALIGAALLAFLPQLATDLGARAGLNDLQAAEISPLVFGLVMMIVIVVAPAGLVGSIRGAIARRRRRAALSDAKNDVTPGLGTETPGTGDDAAPPTQQTDARLPAAQHNDVSEKEISR
ncbi:branched-chain amino acid transport system permease protein [Naumannella cuiyingiana]|uniref:Branched-chain amino acid transport system permease protein n=1 Tax=Naumannella cuiyingiana TaxID=1347891 RepID=A0A7Z0D6Z2_9ACTN|nr:branched-chain amino acid ABC transporter permease [Naumannella cuiyingiana]NYI70005.1 branched-chain amino acid transport system permease protein [Naumannella cuiyingiana]